MNNINGVDNVNVGDSVSDVEYEFYCFMNDKSGSFTTSLFKTIFCADTINRYKLSTIYKEHVQVVMDYQCESNYWDDLQARINKLNKKTKEKNVK